MVNKKPRRRGINKVMDKTMTWVIALVPSVLTIATALSIGIYSIGRFKTEVKSELTIIRSDLNGKIRELELEEKYIIEALSMRVDRYVSDQAILTESLKSIEVKLTTLLNTIPYIYVTNESLKSKTNKED
jgi:hypothetical protein